MENEVKATVLARLGLAEQASLVGALPEQMIAALQDQRWEVRASAARVLGNARESISLDPLKAAIGDEHPAVRAAVVRSLGQIGKQAIDIVGTSLSDPHPLVREAAVTVIGNIGVCPSSDLLVGALLDEDGSVRMAAIYAYRLLELPIPSSILKGMLCDADWQVREALVETLGLMGEREVLLHFTCDEQMFVCEAAARALLKSERSEACDFVEAMFQEGEPAVREAAEKAVKVLTELGRDIHEEYYRKGLEILLPIKSLKCLDSSSMISKAVRCYLVGRALDVLEMSTSLAHLLQVLREPINSLSSVTGIWKAFETLADNVLKGRRRVRLLFQMEEKQDYTIRGEVSQTIIVLRDLGRMLLGQRDDEHGKTMRSEGESLSYLLKVALTALEERESLEALFADLDSADLLKKVAAERLLMDRARKALVNSVPAEPVVISVRGASGRAPVELQFGTSSQEKVGRQVIPWRVRRPARLVFGGRRQDGLLSSVFATSSYPQLNQG